MLGQVYPLDRLSSAWEENVQSYQTGCSMKYDYFTIVALMKKAKTLEEFHQYSVLLVKILKEEKHENVK
jgi:hypothetical protein